MSVDTTPKNWNRDGWAPLDWQTVELFSRVLLKAGIDLDAGRHKGVEMFTPDELLDIADRTVAIGKRLRELAKSYK
jgi:hypothetical protein